MVWHDHFYHKNIENIQILCFSPSHSTLIKQREAVRPQPKTCTFCHEFLRSESHVYMWVHLNGCCSKSFDIYTRLLTIMLTQFGICKLTDFTIDGRPHSVLRSLLLWRRPCLSMSLSNTSTPITLGFMGLGYFCIAALVTVSQGWLLKDAEKQKGIYKTLQTKVIQMETLSDSHL